MEVTKPNELATHAVIGGSAAIDYGVSDSAEFFDILSRTLYTDQKLAVVREVLCNAWDAHIDASITDKPIQITLSGDNLIVRDFGYGIPHKDIGPIYAVYGNSTKKKCKKSTGGFGLGCKAPFAYTDHFEVISHNDGVKTLYNMSKSNAVAAGKPGVITIAQFPTTEQGLQVKIPINNIDWKAFDRLIKRIAMNGEMLVKHNGEMLSVLPFSTYPHGYLLTRRQIMDSDSNDQILLRYGNVIYPITNSPEISQNHAKIVDFLRRFNDFRHSYSLVLQAPPDSIAVTPSRESLSMQEHTIKTLNILLSKFSKHVEGVSDEILIQSRKMIDEAVGIKDYKAIFSNSWGFSRSFIAMNQGDDIIDLPGIAQHQMTKSYPEHNVNFRKRDVTYRVSEAIKAKIVDTHLATSFLKTMPEMSVSPSRYSFSNKANSTDWLQRNVIGKVMSKLYVAGLDPDGLNIIDNMDPSYSYNEILLPAKLTHRRNHLINLPFIRKVIVVTTAITSLKDRLNAYAHHNPNTPTDGILCYYIRSRKVAVAKQSVEFFEKLGYEVINLTKRHSWESTPVKRPKSKPIPYEGLPALSNIRKDAKTIELQAFRADKAATLPTPEFVLTIKARSIVMNAIDGFDEKATHGIVKEYGKRVGVARTVTEYKKAIKHGSLDFLEYLEEQLLTTLKTSPTVAEYFAYDPNRVRDTIVSYKTNAKALLLVYKEPELLKMFDLKNNLTSTESNLVAIFNGCSKAFKDTYIKIWQYQKTIPIASENKKVIEACAQDGPVGVLDAYKIEYGLKSSKRSIYLDLFTRALKG